MNIEDRPYFASNVGTNNVRLEKNDALNVYESDGQAIQQCIKDALKGDKYALKQLVLAGQDTLVQQYMEELK